MPKTTLISKSWYTHTRLQIQIHWVDHTTIARYCELLKIIDGLTFSFLPLLIFILTCNHRIFLNKIH